jgi:hypothetical protein
MGKVRARGVGCAPPSRAGRCRARRPTPGGCPRFPGRWLLAVTPVSGTAHSRSVRVTRPTVPTILSL